jgi:hypothetical protein
MASFRTEIHPGRFKERPNQAGSYVFVAPRLVQGTLIEGFRRLADLPLGFPRATYGLFVVSEVHPYDDGKPGGPGGHGRPTERGDQRARRLQRRRTFRAAPGVALTLVASPA